jgi:hypothetical protein
VHGVWEEARRGSGAGGAGKQRKGVFPVFHLPSSPLLKCHRANH